MKRRQFLRDGSLALMSSAISAGCTLEVGQVVPAAKGRVFDRALSFGPAAQTWRLPGPGDLVRWTASADCYIRFGDERVTAHPSNSMRFNNGTELLLLPRHDYVSVMALQEDGELQMNLAQPLADIEPVDTDRIVNYTYGQHGRAPGIMMLPRGARRVRICVDHNVRCAFGSGSNPPEPRGADARAVALQRGTHLLQLPDNTDRFAVLNEQPAHGTMNLVCYGAADA